MELSFETRRLFNICRSGARARKVLGTSAAEDLKVRLADLRAAESLADLPNPLYQWDETGREVIVTLASKYKVRLQPNHGRLQTSTDGAVRLDLIHRLKLLEITEDG